MAASVIPSLWFIRQLFAGIVPSAYIAIVAAPSFAARWFDDAETASAYGQQQADDGRDTYIALGAHGKRLSSGRGKAKNIVGIGGVWADVDIAHPDLAVHKKQNLVKNVAEADALVESVFPKPSIAIHSGHGMQYYWLFKEPWTWELGDDEERAKAATFVSDWTDTLRDAAKARGVDVDATKDLARIFRLPGTTNFKSDPVPVKISKPVKLNARLTHHGIEDLRTRLKPREPKSTRATKKIPVVGDNGKLTDRVIDPEISAKIQIVCEVDPKFASTWLRKRNFQDQSASSYDLAILNVLVATGGWSEADGIEACRAWRALHGEDVGKLDRGDYVERTLARMRVKTGAGLERNEIYEQLEQQTGVKITAVERCFPGVPVKIRVHVVDSEGEPLVLIFPDSAILNRNAVAWLDACVWQARVAPRKLKGKAWDDVVMLMARAAATLDTGQENSEDGETLGWLRAFRSNQNPVDVIDWRESPDRGCFVFEERFFFTVGDLARAVRIGGARITDRGLCQRLRAVGCTRKTCNVKTIHDKRTSRSVWSMNDSHLIQVNKLE